MRNGADFLKAAKARTTEPIEIDGAKAFVRALSIKEVNDLSGPFQQDHDRNPAELTNLFIHACLVDAKGNRLLSSVDEVQELSPIAFRLISEAVARVNGYPVPGN